MGGGCPHHETADGGEFAVAIQQHIGLLAEHLDAGDRAAKAHDRAAAFEALHVVDGKGIDLGSADPVQAGKITQIRTRGAFGI